MPKGAVVVARGVVDWLAGCRLWPVVIGRYWCLRSSPSGRLAEAARKRDRLCGGCCRVDDCTLE